MEAHVRPAVPTTAIIGFIAALEKMCNLKTTADVLPPAGVFDSEKAVRRIGHH